MAVASNGDIYQAGTADLASGGATELYLARFLPGGTLDPSFGSHGVVYENVGDGATPSTAMFTEEFTSSAYVAITPSGDPVVYTQATTTSSSQTQGAVLEFTQSGSLNTAFHSTGVYKFNLGTSTLPGGLAVQSNGDIVLTGAVTQSSTEFFAERLTGAGALDPGFGSGGIEELPSVAAGFGVLAQANGDLVFGGAALGSSDPEFAITRLTSAGQPDGSFGTGGTAIAAPPQTGVIAEAFHVVATPDGGYALSGLLLIPPVPPASSPTFEPAVARFSGSGQLTSGFGSGGFVSLSSSFQEGFAGPMVAEPTGQLLLTGTGLSTSGAGSFLALLNSNGTLDTNFGSGGVVTTGPFEAFTLDAAAVSPTTLLLSGAGLGSGSGTSSFLEEVNVDAPPTVAFIFAPHSVTVGVPVEFLASAIPTDGLPITQVSWDLGSGKLGDATGTTPTKTFRQPGVYTVRVQATDSFGLSSAVSSQQITVTGPSMKLGSIAADGTGITFRLSCKTAICAVDAGLVTVEHLKGKKVTGLSAGGRGKHTRKVTIGSAKLKLPAGSKKTVTLKLNGTGKKLLRKFGSVPAEASFVLTDDKNKTVQRTVKIR